MRLQHFSSSTRFAKLCTDPNSKFEVCQKIGYYEQFSWNFSKTVCKICKKNEKTKCFKHLKYQLDSLVDPNKCWKTHIYLQISVPKQPKTSRCLTAARFPPILQMYLRRPRRMASDGPTPTSEQAGIRRRICWHFWVVLQEVRWRPIAIQGSAWITAIDMAFWVCGKFLMPDTLVNPPATCISPDLLSAGLCKLLLRQMYPLILCDVSIRVRLVASLRCAVNMSGFLGPWFRLHCVQSNTYRCSDSDCRTYLSGKIYSESSAITNRSCEAPISTNCRMILWIGAMWWSSSIFCLPFTLWCIWTRTRNYVSRTCRELSWVVTDGHWQQFPKRSFSCEGFLINL